jgi:RimJ/RimL family protein N-acetyltransferase
MRIQFKISPVSVATIKEFEMILQGKNIRLRLVTIEDAEFILQLRIDENKSKYLSKVENDLAKQKNWIANYKIREAEQREFYFIIESNQGKSLGTVRIYDLQEDSFCWGSWLMKDNAPFSAAIETALLVYEFGFNTLNYRHSHFDVNKKNLKVIKFHKNFGALEVGQDDENLYLTLSLQQYQLMKDKYRRFI